MSIAGAKVGMIGSANAQSSKTKPANVSTAKPGANASLGSLKQIDAGALNFTRASLAARSLRGRGLKTK
jgi:hypothetical protein